MRINSRSALAVAAAAAALLAVSGCGAPKSDGGTAAGSGTGETSGSANCTATSLPTIAKGKLTIGTDDPAYAPWFSGNKPANGKGYESAVGYAIAKKLGYGAGRVRWVKVPFNNATTPGRKNFDIDLNQVSISRARAKAVDFSSGYYDVTQAVVTYHGSKVASAKSVADLKKAKLGAQVGSTSYTAITEQIKPSSTPAVFDTNSLAVQALKNHQIDGIVVDLPTAFYMTAVQLKDGVIAGQLPTGAKPEQFGAVLTKGSPLTGCVSRAVDALRSGGTLTRLDDTWLAKQGAPKLAS